MGDLISRSALIKMLETYKFGCLTNEVERDYIKETMIEFVKTEPTAYNVEKVVEEIRKQFGCKDCEYTDVFPTPAVCSCECAELEVINDICEIVKRGGIDGKI